MEDHQRVPKEEDSSAKAKMLSEQVCLRLKEAMAQPGGAEAILYWLRAESEKKSPAEKVLCLPHELRPKAEARQHGRQKNGS